MAAIKQRGRAWRAQLCVNGIRESRSFDTEAEAKDWARRREAEILCSQLRAPDEEVKGTLYDLLEKLKQTKTTERRTRRTQQAETYRISRLQRHPICKKVVRDLTIEDFETYKRARRAEGVTTATVRRELNIVRARFNDLVADRMLVSNPVAHAMKKMGKDREVARLLTPDEMARLKMAHEELNHHPRKNPWLFWALEFAAESGLRKSELLGLRWEDVNLQRRVAHIRRVHDLPDGQGNTTTDGTKNGLCRDLPLSPTAIEILNSLPRAVDPRARNWVFPTTYDALECAFQRLKRRAGIADVRWHDLRHMAATKHLKRLKNVGHAAIVTGHKDWKSLRRYVHLTADDVALLLQS